MQVQLEDQCQRIKFETNDETLLLGDLATIVNTASGKQPLNDTTNLTQTGLFPAALSGGALPASSNPGVKKT